MVKFVLLQIQELYNMPKYTAPPATISSSTLVRSSDWNTYFGSIGNLQWAYDELQNITGGRFVMLKNAKSSVTSANNVCVFANYTEAYGAIDFANTITGTIQTPLHTGYVWVSACLNHTIGSAVATTFVPNFTISIFDVGDIFTSTVGPTSTMYTANGYTNRGGSAANPSIAPLVRALSISCIIPVSNGARRLRVGVNRHDAQMDANSVTINHFTVVPLGDVSGLANFLNEVEDVIE